MTRMMFLTFFTGKRWSEGVHPHEAPAVMTIPLIVLAALSVLGGVMLLGDWIVDWLAPVTGTAPHEDPPLPAIVISLIAVVVVAVGAGLAWVFVGSKEVPREAPRDVSFVTRAARAELYGNEINDYLVVNPSLRLTSGLVAADSAVVDGGFNGGGLVVSGAAQGLRRLQTGYVRSYALSLLGGAVLLVLTLVVVNV
jgi:NADH-quinone oxidoreductase subunit L